MPPASSGTTAMPVPTNLRYAVMYDEWWALLAAIAPIRAETDLGRTAKLHAAMAAMRHSEDGFAELADDLVKSALAEFVEHNPFASEPLRPDEIEALRQLGPLCANDDETPAPFEFRLGHRRMTSWLCPIQMAQSKRRTLLALR